jgi:hypothetical protein
MCVKVALRSSSVDIISPRVDVVVRDALMSQFEVENL